MAHWAALRDPRAKDGRTTWRSALVDGHIAQVRGYAQRNFAAQTWLAANAHTDQCWIRLMWQFLVVLDALGMHDMPAQEQESEAVESLPYWLVANWAWGFR